MLIKHARILRFLAVGSANAAISFGILNLSFYQFGQSKIASSFIATGCALLFSFMMNRLFVFADKSRRKRQQFLPFAIVTISGSFIVINLVYILTLHILEGNTALANFINSATGLKISQSFLEINLSTVAGALVAMVWNYNGYRLFVFKGSKEDKNDRAVETAKEVF